jgi:hypothetical protein
MKTGKNVPLMKTGKNVLPMKDLKWDICCIHEFFKKSFF